MKFIVYTRQEPGYDFETAFYVLEKDGVQYSAGTGADYGYTSLYKKLKNGYTVPDIIANNKTRFIIPDGFKYAYVVEL